MHITGTTIGGILKLLERDLIKAAEEKLYGLSTVNMKLLKMLIIKKVIGNVLLISILCISMISCETDKKKSNEKIFKERDFLTKKVLKGTTISILNFQKPVRIKVIPEYNLLLTLVTTQDDYLAQAFSLDSFKYLKSFVKAGKGAGEQLSAPSVQYKHGEKVIYVSDMYKKTIYTYSIDSILYSSSVKPIDSLRIESPDLFMPLILNDQKIVTQRRNFRKDMSFDYDSIGVYDFYDERGKWLNASGEYPVTSHEYRVNELSDAFVGGINLSEDRTKLILNYYNTDIVDLSDIKGRLIKRVHGPDNFEPQMHTNYMGEKEITFQERNSRFGYTGMARMNKNILLVLYNGTPVDKNEYHTTRLYQFDSSLSPQTFYILDKPIFDFDVDWKAQTIYGLTNLGGDKIITFKF